MIVAHLVVEGKQPEQREVPDDWLHIAAAGREPIMIGAVPYRAVNVEHYEIGGQTHADVTLERTG